ncbi:hypothetical protein BDN72DRAFT_842058 [Pluteus cervinus]|uniref:Uncharacterized protein n=1 Tax=Pluteus cervinus TaxID=181527 RepID=A0ACD3ASM4_9AGAR|nr:hypothetical protein BDN72DRAFT_842058 [Pluteus cervinus]
MIQCGSLPENDPVLIYVPYQFGLEYLFRSRWLTFVPVLGGILLTSFHCARGGAVDHSEESITSYTMHSESATYVRICSECSMPNQIMISSPGSLQNKLDSTDAARLFWPVQSPKTLQPGSHSVGDAPQRNRLPEGTYGKKSILDLVARPRGVEKVGDGLTVQVGSGVLLGSRPYFREVSRTACQGPTISKSTATGKFVSYSEREHRPG